MHSAKIALETKPTTEREMFTCCIRYTIDLDKLDEFREYARSWISLIRKYGGVHHGYFIPARDGDNLPNTSFSFPGMGTDGPPNIAVALFSFPDIETYDKYRRDVSQDEGCKAATDRFNETKCFSRYERTFLLPMFE
jgi:hypothetical protein